MNLEQFCAYNDISKVEPFLVLGTPLFPEGSHRLDFTLVVHSQTGLLDLVVDGKQYRMFRRSLLVLRPGQTVEVLEKSDSFRARTLVIGGDIGMELNISDVFLTMFIVDETPVFKVTAGYSDAVRIFFEAFGKVASFDANPYRMECIRSMLRSFFYSSGYFLFQSLHYGGDDLYKISSKFSGYSDSIVSRFLSLAETHAETKRTLDFYASALDYNPRYLSALIKKETGQTGQSIIDQYCVLKAMAKLAYSDRTIKEISNEMDFPSQSDFGKFFKRMTGNSPLEYRKRRQEGSRRHS